jgi:hypothetical protein
VRENSDGKFDFIRVLEAATHTTSWKHVGGGEGEDKVHIVGCDSR